MKELNRHDLSDILYGAAILGAGGGGDLEEGFGLIDQAIAAGKSFKLVSVDEVPDTALVCTPYLLGAISPPDPDEEREYEKLPRASTHPILIAYQAFQEYLEKQFYATIACELGGSNTAVAFFCAAMNDHCVLDADPAGRAVPEITHSTYYIAGLPASPIFTANEFGETCLLNHIADDQRAERIVRALCRVSRNDIAAIDHALDMGTLKPALIHGTISKAMNMGRVWREFQHASDLAHRVAHAGGGVLGFSGEVSLAQFNTVDGFTKGTIEIAGKGDFDAQRFKILIKNENLAAWLNDEVRVTIPDLICLIDKQSSQPVTNPHAFIGQQVDVILLPAPVEFTSAKGLAVFGPAYAGIDTPYRSILG